MINNFEQLKNYLNNLRTNEYQRYNFDEFLLHVKFAFDLPAIHIAGTNGKGSTGTFLNNIYKCQGYKVGYFHSPYYLNMDEMILCNNKKIEIEYIDKIISKYDKLIKKFKLSEFELETFIAFNYFKEKQVDIAIIECGMGGEDDATNIFTPILSIITSISLEHTLFLGSSITEIANNKAGIIKNNVNVVIGQLNEEASQVIVQVANSMHSLVYKSDPFYNEKIIDLNYHFDTTNFKDLQVQSTGLYSIMDAMIALKAIDCLKDSFPVNEKSIREGLKKSTLVGRMTIINNEPLTIIDGAHNPEAIDQLCSSLNKLNFQNKEIHVIFAAFLDKNIQNMLGSLNFLTNSIFLTTFPHSRARKEEDYLLYLQEYPFFDDSLSLYNQIKNQYPSDIIVICGSLAFAFYMFDKLNGEK